MDFNTTIDLIIRDLEEAAKIIDDLKSYAGVPAIQVELAKSKCKSAAEVIGLLKTIVPVESGKGEKTTTPAPEQQQKLSKEVNTKTTSAVASLLQQKAKTDKIISESESFTVSETEISFTVSKPDTAGATIGDSFGHLSDRFNELVGSQRGEEDISEVLKSKPVSDLNEVIGINDRFVFIKEIFNGNKEAYSQAISRLEISESLTDAKAVIMSYTGENTENEAVKQLLDLVKRKLPANE